MEWAHRTLPASSQKATNLVSKESRHDDVIESAQNARHILRSLSLSNLDGVRPQIDGVSPQPEEALS